jgi:hypothetical protein
VEGDLRVVGAGLDAQIAAREVDVEIVAGKVAGISSSAAGLREANPNRSSPSFSKSVGPNPKVTVRRPAARSWASPVPSGGTKASWFSPPTGCPAHILAAASDHVHTKSRTSSAFEMIRSKEAKCNLSCWGVAMPA